MKVLQVLPLVDEHRTYGGPVSVSEAQVKALRDGGHDVTQIACGRQEDEGILGGSAHLFPYVSIPRLGRWSLTSPGLLRWLRSHVSSFDIVHVHLARDLTMLPAVLIAARAEVPVVVQTHGMIGGASGLRGLLDRVVSARVLRRAGAQLVLTSREARDIAALTGSEQSLRVLENGVSVSGTMTDGPAETPTMPTFVFVGRLTERKRPDHFVRASRTVLDDGVTADFVVAGPDDGMGPTVRSLVEELGLAERVSMVGPLRHDEALALIQGASVFVLPSVDEPFPMAVLEAMALGTAVIITRECGLASVIEEAGAGLVIAPDEASLAAAMSCLARDPERVQACGQAGARLVQQRFSAEHVGTRLVELYEEVTT